MALLSRRDKDGMNRRRMIEVVRANEGNCVFGACLFLCLA